MMIMVMMEKNSIPSENNHQFMLCWRHRWLSREVNNTKKSMKKGEREKKKLDMRKQKEGIPTLERPYQFETRGNY